jgi:hypothetical protein
MNGGAELSTYGHETALQIVKLILGGVKEQLRSLPLDVKRLLKQFLESATITKQNVFEEAAEAGGIVPAYATLQDFLDACSDLYEPLLRSIRLDAEFLSEPESARLNDELSQPESIDDELSQPKINRALSQSKLIL